MIFALVYKHFVITFHDHPRQTNSTRQLTTSGCWCSPGRSACAELRRPAHRMIIKPAHHMSTVTLPYTPIKVHQRVNQRVNKRASHWYHVELLSLPGELFLRMLKMLILPLIMFSLMAGLGSLDTKVAGALGWRTVLYYITTTLIAVVLGLTLVMVIQPGGRGSACALGIHHL